MASSWSTPFEDLRLPINHLPHRPAATLRQRDSVGVVLIRHSEEDALLRSASQDAHRDDQRAIGHDANGGPTNHAILDVIAIIGEEAVT
jgi:hypothetical protein